MIAHPRSLVVIAVTIHLYAAIARGADPAPNEVTVESDLTAVIALQGFPCGQVVSVTQRGKDDYVASCQDGNRYRVFLNTDGRVVVEKQ